MFIQFINKFLACLYVCAVFFIFLGLVSKVEKNLSDHTEFLNYKNEMDKWLANANDILDDCGGIGDVQQTQQKLDTVNVSGVNFMFEFFATNVTHFYRAYPTAFRKDNT